MFGEFSILDVAVALLRTYLWVAPAIAIVLWFALMVGLGRDIVAMVCSFGGGKPQISASDRRFLRGIHIQPR